MSSLKILILVNLNSREFITLVLKLPITKRVLTPKTKWGL